MIQRLSAIAVTSLLVHALTCHPAAAAEPRGPSTPEERAQALRLVELLESTPGAPEAKEAAKWLTVWLVNVPDLTINFCFAPLGSTKELEGVPPNLMIHHGFAQAAFLIRHPEAKSGSLEVYAAGVEGTLRAYESMRKSGAVSELKPFEALKKERDAGTLVDVVSKRIKGCDGKS